MKILYWKNNKLKFFGLSLLKIKVKEGKAKAYIGSIPVCNLKTYTNLLNILAEFQKNKDFDTHSFDKRISKFISYKYKNITPLNKNSIAYLVTLCADMGGHTKCIRDLVKSLKNKYEQTLFFTQITACLRLAPRFLSEIEKMVQIVGKDTTLFLFNKEVQTFSDKIIKLAPKALLVYIHPDDVFAVGVLAYLKKTSNIKIIFFNHASHFPNLGMSFADIILECIPTTEKITKEKRHLTNTRLIGLQSLPAGETKYLSKSEINKIKNKLGISNNAFITMSGASSYKFFEEGDSAYFKMIKKLLEEEPRLVHIIISEFNNEQKRIIKNIFKNSELEKNLKIIPYQTDFDKYFQCADVFIDSFPISSALTQIDLMRNKVTSIVKINKERPEFSFHEYQMPNYPYMFEQVNDMKNAILELLHNKDKRKTIINANYDFWLKTYESNVVREKYINILENC